jgi:hypothetical protein
MNSRTIFAGLVAVGLCAFLISPAFAQGGWDSWKVHMRDGSESSASPVWSLDQKELRHSFGDAGAGKGYAVERSKIGYMSNSLGNSAYRASNWANFKTPELPTGDLKQDVVVLDDGRRITGAVMIRPGKKKSGEVDIYNPVLVQNGVETELTKVAHIVFATGKNPPKK